MINITDKPVFNELNDTTIFGVEGETLFVSLQADGHPSTITYNWIKNGVPLLGNFNYIVNGSTLNFTKLLRTDTGAYTCEAFNSEGSTSLNFTLNVKCEY